MGHYLTVLIRKLKDLEMPHKRDTLEVGKWLELEKSQAE